MFIAPATFTEAVTKLGLRSPIGSLLTSAQWESVPVALRERAFFSSTVENLRFLQRARDFLLGFLTGVRETLPDGASALAAGSRAEFVKQLSAFAVSEGMGALDPDLVGGVQDIRSQKRLELIFDVNTRAATDFGYWKQGMDADVLDEYPAQRFIRVHAVKEPRVWHTQFEDGVWLKTDLDSWIRINQDFGVPWGPFGWGCGHDVEDVDRAESESLGLLEPGQRVEPVEQDFNSNLAASTQGLDEDLVSELRGAFGDQIEIEGDRVKWKP